MLSLSYCSHTYCLHIHTACIFVDIQPCIHTYEIHMPECVCSAHIQCSVFKCIQPWDSLHDSSHRVSPVFLWGELKILLLQPERSSHQGGTECVPKHTKLSCADRAPGGSHHPPLFCSFIGKGATFSLSTG